MVGYGAITANAGGEAECAPNPPYEARAERRPYCSMAVARNALLGDALVFDGGLEHHAVGELVDHGALDLLPGGLTLRDGVAALLDELGPARRELGFGDQHVDGAAVEVDAHAVAGLDQREPAAGRRLRGCVEDRWPAGGAGLAAVADAGERIDALLDEGRGRLHIHHLGRARIADRPDPADDQDGGGINSERRIIDAVVVVLRPVER